MNDLDFKNFIIWILSLKNKPTPFTKTKINLQGLTLEEWMKLFQTWKGLNEF